MINESLAGIMIAEAFYRGILVLLTQPRLTDQRSCLESI